MLETARERIEVFVDDNSFVEIGAQMTARSTDFSMQSMDIPSDGIITGHGLVDGSLIFVFAQDPDVLGGTMGETHIRKIIGLYDMAIRLGAPIVGLIDSKGIRLLESLDATESMAKLYAKVTEASGIVPTILGIFGKCGGAMSIYASLCDFVYMTDDAQLFLQSPDALDGNYKAKKDTSSAKFQYENAGNCDGIGSEIEVVWQMRTLLSTIPGSNREGGLVVGCSDELNRGLEGLESKRSDIKAFCEELSDEGLFVPVKNGRSTEMVCGFIRLGGVTVGVVGNQPSEEHREPVITIGGANKATAFIKYCDAFDIPILSLVNLKGYDPTVNAEVSLPRALARLTAAFATSTVPKVTLYLKDACGSAYLMMNPKMLGADLVYAFPDANIEIMDAKSAARIIQQDLPGDLSITANDFAAKHSGVLNAAKHGYINRIVDFADTRKYLIDAFGILFTKQGDVPKKRNIR